MIAPDQQELFDSLVTQAGGTDHLSRLQLETVAAIVKATEMLRQAGAADVPRIAATLIKLTAQLPPAPAHPEPDWSKFNDEQLDCIERALLMIQGNPDPGPQRGPEAQTPVVEKIRAFIEVAELKEKAANLEAQLDALLKLNALLEQRLAMETTS
jgi:hypothetical protein